MTTRTRGRIATVVLAPVAALVTWGFMRLAGIDFAVETGDGSVGPVDVVVAAVADGSWCDCSNVTPGARGSGGRPSGRPRSPSRHWARRIFRTTRPPSP
jgi:hypothetical protein